MNPSCNLFLIGPTGAGKTSIGRRLAEHYGLPFVDIDHEIEAHTGVTVATIFEIEGEAGFRQRESAHIEQCSSRDGLVLATGAGAVLDAVNGRLLRERGFTVWLQVDIDQQIERLEHDRQRPLLAGTDRRERLQSMALAREPYYRQLADLAVPGQHEGVTAATARTIELIDQHWQRQRTHAA
jgi:shikimate kinase